MKSTILVRTIAGLLLAAPAAHSEDNRAEEKKDVTKSTNASASTSVVTSGDGTATVTIDINGKKETRTFKLGDGTNTFSFGTDDGVAVGGAVSGGGASGPKFDLMGKVKKEKGPWIGIAMEPVDEVVRSQLSLAPGEGVVVSHVMPESPAAKAGLAANDILLRFDDQIVVEPSQLRKLISMKKPGDTAKLRYLRKGERNESTVTIVEHEINASDRGPMPWIPMGPGQVRRLERGGPEVAERIKEMLRQMKERKPGIIVDKRSWSGIPGGDQFLETLKKLERELDNLNLPKEERERIRRSAEEAFENARQAIERAANAVKRPRKEDDRKHDEPSKKPAESL